MTTPSQSVQPLPADLATAETSLQEALKAALESGSAKRWGASLRFENLRVLPVACRLAHSLNGSGYAVTMLWPDAGAAALARRDAPELAESILDFRQWMACSNEDTSETLLLAVMPQPADYEDFVGVCEAHSGSIVMLNGRLEDAAVGIGSVARERRRGFVASWQQAYWLQPLEGGALMRCYPADWHVYRSDPDGYRQISVEDNRPDPETLAALLADESADGIKQQLATVDRFLDGLRN